MQSLCKTLVVVFVSFFVLFFAGQAFSGIKTADIPLGSGPHGIAINEYTNTAVVVNEYSSSLSVVDLAGRHLLATLSVDWTPKGVAVDREINTAIVAGGWGTVSLIDLNALAIVKTINTRKLAKAVSVSEADHRAFVVNYDGTISVINLLTQSLVRTLTAVAGASDIAIDPGLNIALAARQSADRVTVLDLNTYRIIRTLSVGDGPTAIAVNPETHIAAVVSKWSGTMTSIDLETWRQRTLRLGMMPWDIAVNPLDNTALITGYLSKKLLQVDLTTNMLCGAYPVHWFSSAVAVNNFTNTAGITEDETSALTLLELPNPVPEITAVTPGSAQRGSQGQAVTIAGNKFVASSQVSLSGLSLETTFEDNHTLHAAIPQTVLKTGGVLPLTVTTPSPGGGASESIHFSVLNPAPTITALEPGSAVAGTQGLDIAVYGSGFFDDTAVSADGVFRPFTLIGQSKLQLELSAADLAHAGLIAIAAANPPPGGGQSQEATFSVLNPLPVLSGLSPESAITGSSLTLTLNGANFVSDSEVRFNGAPAEATYVSGSRIDLPLSPAQLSTAGSYTVQVVNPGPGGGASGTLSLTVNSASAVQPLPEGSYGAQYEDLVPADATIASYDPKRFSLITGLVQDKALTPLQDVVVSIKDHPEYGSAKTDSSGRFSLPLEGGGTITVVYQKTGFLTSHRQVNTGWNTIGTTETVTLLTEDPAATVIAFDGNPSTVLTHRSSTLTDGFGSRALTMVFSGDNRAYAKDANGAEVPLATITTRATEYDTPESMPAKLPPTSAFTYCAELSVDGAKNVRFEKPVTVYVENFLGFNVGEIVPVGYYDRDRGVWVPSGNGVVVRLLDTNGDGVVDGYDKTGDNLSDGVVVGLTNPSVYRPNTTYWLVEIDHFTPWDCNWPYGPPAGAIAPNPQGEPQKSEQDPCDDQLSINSFVECRSRIFHEDIPIPGTDMTIHYASNRVKGYREVVSVPASGPEVPASLKRIIVKMAVAGRTFETILPAAPNQIAEFIWDGLDYLGREVSGSVVAQVDIGFVYDAFYYSARSDLQQSFATAGANVTGIMARNAITSWKQNTIRINRNGGSGDLAEGWSLSEQHNMSPSDLTILYKGDGTQIGSGGLRVITTVAGNGKQWYSGDGGLATQASFRLPEGIAVDRAGNLYIADSLNCRIRKVDTNGIITTIAGNGQSGYNSDDIGDGGPATQASFLPEDVAVDGEGNLYIADNNVSRIRKVDANGIITTIAGNGQKGYSGDGGPATQAALGYPEGVAVDAAGNLYIADWSNYRVRKVDTNGIITTIAGNGQKGYSGDGGSATQASLWGPDGVAVDAAGNLYITDEGNNRIRKVDTNGIIATIAGNGEDGYNSDSIGDEGLATQAALHLPKGIAVDGFGNLYIADWINHRIRKVDRSGIITTIAGNGQLGFSGDGGPATWASFNLLEGITVDSAGNLYVVDSSRVRKISPGSAIADSLANNAILVSDENGTGYIMSSTGQHQSTIDLATGTTLLSFGYDSSGLLASVTDRFGNQTTIQRDSDGKPLSITSPYGHITSFTVDGDNNLRKVTYPDNTFYAFDYTLGLMTDGYSPKGNHFQHGFDSNGRVTDISDPEGGSWTFSRSVDVSGNVLSGYLTAEGNTTAYLDHTDSTGAYSSTVTEPSGTVTTSSLSADGLTGSQSFCGMELTTQYGLDPQYLYKYRTLATRLTPLGLTRTVSNNRAYEDTNADTVADRITETVTVNGQAWTRVNNTLTGTITSTSPVGRTVTLTYDPSNLLEKNVTVPGLLPVAYGYDQQGRLKTITTGDRTAVIAYDDSGNIDHLVTPDSRTYFFTYDAMGRPETELRPDGSLIQFDYDNNGNVMLLTSPLGAGYGFDYTANDQRKLFATPLSGNYVYTYDKERNLKTLEFPSGKQITNIYTNGLLSGIETPEGTTSYTYRCSTLPETIIRDAEKIGYTYDGTLLKTDTRTGLLNQTISYTYNNNFQPASMTYAGATETFGYDDDGLLTGAGAFTITRNVENGLPEKVNDEAFTAIRSFSGYGELDGISYSIGSTAQYSWSLTRDLAGRIEQKVETLGGTTATYVYAYDDNGRLRGVTKNGLAVESYDYDENGNRIGSDYSLEDHLITAGGVSYDFDADGFLSSRTAGAQTALYQYSSRGELLSVTRSDGALLSYDHDPLGRRITKKVNGSITEKYLWEDQTRLLAIYDSSDNLISRFVYADDRMPLSMTKNGVVYYLLYDQIGSLRAVTDTSGAIVKRIAYDSFGNILSDSNPAFTVPFGFAGGLHDRDTGLVRFGARDYDPSIGRWTAKDPIDFDGGELNLYGYVGNDPVNFADPLGLAACYLIFNNGKGRLMCFPQNPGNSPVDIPVASGNNAGDSNCKNNPSCGDQPNRGPIPDGDWIWTRGYTAKPNGRVLEPSPGNNTDRTLIRSHSCAHAFGPSKTPPFCSEGCVTGQVADIQKLNRLIDAEPGSTLHVW